MNVSDYISEYLIKRGIKDVFAYPGGMITNVLESLRRRKDRINTRLLYHEQALAFAGCSYSEIKRHPTAVFATSGPGATNLITGICNAYFDSIPLVFITGQVNRNESSKGMGVRQRGFQETDVVSICKGITKYAEYVDDPKNIKEYLDKAFHIAEEGRPGPVLLDIPMDVFKFELGDVEIDLSVEEEPHYGEIDFSPLYKASRPVILVGSGAKNSVDPLFLRNVLRKASIPVITSMLAFDVLPKDDHLNFGFIGAYGDRAANFIAAKSDLLISIGARLDIRQVGAIRKNFAKDAKIMRIDIDQGEIGYRVHEDGYDYNLPAKKFLEELYKIDVPHHEEWMNVCRIIKEKLSKVDETLIQEEILKNLSKVIPDDAIITTDVGQNQVWVAQYLNNKDNLILFSGGHGAMGYSLPASIGAAYACKDKTIVSFNGDGGVQMNIQELQTIARDRLPIKIVVLNNGSLGMIRHFQEMYFESNYMCTTKDSGYANPSFVDVAKAYKIKGIRIEDPEDIKKLDFSSKEPLLVEIMIKGETYVTPKLQFGMPNQDQEPRIDRKLYEELMGL